MTTELSTLEIALIKSSIGTRSDVQIAELLERTVDQVQSYLDDLTGTTAADRASDVATYQNEKESSKKKRSSIGIDRAKRLQENESIRKEKASKRLAESTWVQNKKDSKAREERSKCKTRVIDYSSMHSVRIDDKTTILWSDKELEAFTRETGKGKAEFINNLRSKYSGKFDEKIHKIKTAAWGG
jgi:hypothetical protein